VHSSPLIAVLLLAGLVAAPGPLAPPAHAGVNGLSIAGTAPPIDPNVAPDGVNGRGSSSV
jgi:hypothetical protein